LPSCVSRSRRPASTSSSSRKINVDSPLHAISVRESSWLTRSNRNRAVGRWVAELPATFDEYLAERSAKVRQQIRYYDRRLNKTYGDRLRVRRFDQAGEFDELCADIEVVASTTYQYQLGAGVTRDPTQRGLMQAGLRAGRFVAWVLYIDDRPASFWLGESFGPVFATGTPGFDPQFAKDRVGTFTMMRMIDDLCARGDIRRIDFGHGDAEYKKLAGAQATLQRDVVMFAGRPKPIVLNVCISLARAGTDVAVRLISRSSRLAGAKKYWRARLSRTPQAATGAAKDDK